MEKVYNIFPFYYTEAYGVGVRIDGTVNLQLWGQTNSDGRKFKALRMYPLKEQKMPGDDITEDDIDTSRQFLELSFGSDASIDVVIQMLQMIRDRKIEDMNLKVAEPQLEK